MRGESHEDRVEQMYVTLTFGIENGEVVGYEFFPGVHSYAKTAAFWDSVASLALDMKDLIENPPGPVEPGSVEF